MRGASAGFFAPVQRSDTGGGAWRRRIAVVLLLALGMTGISASGAVPPGGRFPLDWLNALTDRAAWAGWTGLDAERGIPIQPNALGHDDGHYASTDQTRARNGAGRDAGGAPGALPAESSIAQRAVQAQAKPPSTAPSSAPDRNGNCHQARRNDSASDACSAGSRTKRPLQDRLPDIS